ncbi:MAG TPA: FAD-binding oxidoreductase [Actinomycetota bacterium]|nr:FAD-binding oxidoreductase [Actinomycetota bacterium]
MGSRDVADLVVVGAGTVGGWASWFARRNGADRVVVLERDLVGQGASSRAAGVVRAQGGTPETVALGRWSIAFYRRQPERFGTDSGFRELGYLILAVTKRDEHDGRARVEMQRAQGLDARWVSAEEAVALNPTLAPEGHRGGSYAATDGSIDPPRNVRAYSLAMRGAKVDLRERTTFLGLRRSKGGRLVGVETSAGVVRTERVVLTGGPTLRAIGRLAGIRIPAGGARHQVVVSEPDPAFDVERLPMVFDLGRGLYWRLEEGGLLWGMSNPTETPGPARRIDWPYLRKMQRRLAQLVPATRGLGIRRAWAATIDYTPDHLPIMGPAITADGEPIDGVTVASAGGHGMMWGPAVAKIAADLAVTGTTKVVDVRDFGLDRFDAQGRSRFYDPIALPFPASFDDE